MGRRRTVREGGMCALPSKQISQGLKQRSFCYRYPGERLSRDQALRGMTLDAAYASFSESTVGSLNVGKKADFVVLSQDIMRIPFNEILTTKVKVTVVDGQLVYGRL